jgi:hypothetical protein
MRRGKDQQRRGRDAVQVVGFGGDQAPEGTRKLRPAGFFGDKMPRTAVLDTKRAADGGPEVAVVEEPADKALAPVTLADIDKGARGGWFFKKRKEGGFIK